jgi:hypothetical protein
MRSSIYTTIVVPIAFGSCTRMSYAQPDKVVYELRERCGRRSFWTSRMNKSVLAALVATVLSSSIVAAESATPTHDVLLACSEAWRAKAAGAGNHLNLLFNAPRLEAPLSWRGSTTFRL